MDRKKGGMKEKEKRDRTKTGVTNFIQTITLGILDQF